MWKLRPLTVLITSLMLSLSNKGMPAYGVSGGMDSWPTDTGPGDPGIGTVSEEMATSGWYQEAHDAHHTGYSPQDVSLPWVFRWQWNGSCSNPLGSDCRPGDPDRGWTFLIPPKSHLVAGDGRLYLPAGEHGIWAIRESDGKTAWHNSAIRSYCTAAFDPETHVLFVAANDGRLYKLNPSSGAIVSSFQADSGLNLAPIIATGRVYVVSDRGILHAVNKRTMDPVWSYVAGSPGQTPAAYSERYDVLVFGTENLYVHAVNNADGSRRWSRKPTVNSAGDFTYDGGDGKRYRAYNYEHGWPVIADEHGIVFISLRLPKSAMWRVPDPGSANWFPSSNEAIRSFLISRPELQTLFALNLHDGSTAFIPAVGTGGSETPNADNTLGPLPVVKRLANGDEIAYTIWRNGQKCEAGDCDDPRWDAVMGEMVLDNTTISDYRAGDCRFVDFSDGMHGLITDEICPVSMAGDVLFHSHWIAMQAYRVTDRTASRGSTYSNPIRTTLQHFIVNRASNQPAWVTCRPNTNHFCSDTMDTYGDRRAFKRGFWVFFNTADPPYQACSSFDCVAPYSDGYKARYTIVNDGTIYYELNGGTIFAIGSANNSQAELDKQVWPVACSRNDTVTYTLNVLGNGHTLTLTDSLPQGLSAPGSMNATSGEVTYDSNRRLIVWHGTPAAWQSVVIRFTATVQVDGPRALSNTAVLTDTGGSVVRDTEAVIVDAYSSYCPLVVRSS